MRKSMAHHHPCSHSDASTTVGVRHYITIANTEKGDGYQPHCIEQICMFFVMVSVFPGKGRTVIERGEGRRGAERAEQEELPGCQIARLRGGSGEGRKGGEGGEEKSKMSFICYISLICSPPRWTPSELLLPLATHEFKSH